MKTILKFSAELEELVGRKWQMAPNRMLQQLTDKTKKKKHRPSYEAVDAHARRRLKKTPSILWSVDAHARRRLKKTQSILWSGRRACASPLKKKHRPFYEAVDAHARRRLIIWTIAGCPPPSPGIHFFVNISKFGLSYFREFATDFPETSQVN